jgi:hypothetical protein
MYYPWIRGHHSYPSADRIVRTVQQLEQVFHPFRTVFREFKKRKKKVTAQCVCKEMRKVENFFILTRNLETYPLRKAMDECS